MEMTKNIITKKFVTIGGKFPLFNGEAVKTLAL